LRQDDVVRTVTARAPGRVNLIGEHLDYNGGLCLPIALPLATTASVRRTGDTSVRLSSGELTWSGRLGDRPTGWPAYVLGVLGALGIDEGLEIAFASDVPIGAGLSSSAALTCSTALALDALLELGLSRDQLARACVRAENDYVGVPTGGLDQAAALFSHPGTALLLDFNTGTRTPVPFNPATAGLELLVIDTGVSHQLGDGAYAGRRADCEAAAADIEIDQLALATYEDLSRVRNERVRRRARHIVTEQSRVLAFVAAASAGDWVEAGALMTASHLSLRDDFEVSCVELDVVVAGALASGALGARMTGGGFGGSAISVVASDLVPAVVARIAADFVSNGWEAPTPVRVEASAGAALLD
jgi:galactokinase